MYIGLSFDHIVTSSIIILKIAVSPRQLTATGNSNFHTLEKI